ncbi:BQ5605_C004g03075 [Microbotryum silenes-dioicae]|uniref:BQ5605_C004g03075 protein n=1 Tax=Microbotryum silenes-dioicae TaxID=796604 RepID=A0A2X0PBY7_9BASI|nr:BQ5605_C004g03075 [Microbotryum silenes-dioicae]
MSTSTASASVTGSAAPTRALAPIALPSPLPRFFLVYPTTWRPLSTEYTHQSSPTVRINVLDSSFNPPHVAHYSLARLAAFDCNGTSPFDARLLVLGSSNADKGSTGQDEMNTRLEMMRCMAIELDQDLAKGGGRGHGQVGVAVVEGARFVDKSKHVREWIKEHHQGPEVELVFALGWDTVIRFFNPKYYGTEFESFMTSFFDIDRSSIVCARRGDVSPIEEEEFLSSPNVHKYRERITMCDVDDQALNVSSTDVRKALKEGRRGDVDKWINVQGVREVIKKERLYEQ